MNYSAIEARIDSFIAENRDQLFRDLKTLIDIDSVESAPLPGAPYGAGIRKALDAALEIAARLGLKTGECDGYMGYADVEGQSERQLATIAHLDVVPAGNGWDSDPFGMIEREGWVIGRGVIDDKGPAVLTLYLAKFFREYCQATGETLPYTLRILLGCSEETGMTDIDYYLERNPMPAFCFTPDANFPVGYGEKGGFGGLFVSRPLQGNLMDFQGGVAGNVVPDRATAVVKTEKQLTDTEQVKVERQGDCVSITGYGIGGHASMPQGTVNAIGLVVDYLLDNGLCSPEENKYLNMLRVLHSCTDGSSFGIDCVDEVFDPLTCIGGVIRMEDGVLSQSIDVRFPTAITGDELIAKSKALAATGDAEFTPSRVNRPFYIKPDSPAILALLDTYNQVTGQNKAPFTMGGGTYARHFDNAVSFGPEDDIIPLPEWVGTMHGANEGANMEFMLQALKIYILSMAKLMDLSF